jgi:hypothetical protein
MAWRIDRVRGREAFPQVAPRNGDKFNHRGEVFASPSIVEFSAPCFNQQRSLPKVLVLDPRRGSTKSIFLINKLLKPGGIIILKALLNFECSARREAWGERVVLNCSPSFRRWRL